MSARRLRTYDHRLVQLVQRTGDIEIATRQGVPRSTASGWMRQDRGEVVSDPVFEANPAELQARIVRLERRLRRASALLRVVLALLRILRPDLSHVRIPKGSDKRRLLGAIDRARGIRGLQRLLLAIGLSPSRLSAWRRAAQGCELQDAESCPGSSPHALTHAEIAAIEDMVMSPAYMPDSRPISGVLVGTDRSLAVEEPHTGGHFIAALHPDAERPIQAETLSPVETCSLAPGWREGVLDVQRVDGGPVA